MGLNDNKGDYHRSYGQNFQPIKILAYLIGRTQEMQLS